MDAYWTCPSISLKQMNQSEFPWCIIIISLMVHITLNHQSQCNNDKFNTTIIKRSLYLQTPKLFLRMFSLILRKIKAIPKNQVYHLRGPFSYLYQLLQPILWRHRVFLVRVRMYDLIIRSLSEVKASHHCPSIRRMSLRRREGSSARPHLKKTRR
jgi:hypothetical protein